MEQSEKLISSIKHLKIKHVDNARYLSDYYRRVRLVIFISFIFSFIPIAGGASSISSVIPDSSKQYWVSFRQNFNTYTWQLGLFYKKSIRNIELRFNESILSSMLKIGRENPKWNDDKQVRLQMFYHISPVCSFYATNSSLIFVDRQSGFVNDITTQSGLVGIQFNQLNKIKISPGIGWKFDTRFQRKDEGFTYNVATLIDQTEINGYYNSLNFSVDGDKIGSRINQNTTLYYKLYKEFYEQTTDTITVLLNRKRQDNYVINADDIETFNEKINTIVHSLKYRITDDAFVTIHNKLSNRQVEVSHRTSERRNRILAQPFTSYLEKFPVEAGDERRKRTDYRSEHDLSFFFNYSTLKGYFGLRYWSQEQLYDIPAAAKNLPFSFRTSFVAQDNQSYEVSAFSKLGWQFLKSDSLGFDAYISRLQYDTPDPSNFDDRDEFRLKLNLIEIHFFSPFLRLQMEANLNLYHTVYIFAERSADNNWTRIIRLSPGVMYEPFSIFKLKQNFEVLAKYVDFDYEFEISDISSFVYRKFSSETQLDYRFFPQTWIQLHYRLELEENGKLFWDRWAERPLIFRNNSWLRASVSYKLNHHVEISPGVNLYTRDEWRYIVQRTGESQKEKYSDFQSIGPVLSLYYQPSSTLKFSFSANRQRISGTQQKSYSVSYVEVFLNYFF